MIHHDHADPRSYINAIEMAWLASDSTVPRCLSCNVTYRMLPMTGAAWGLEVFHEAHCREHDENLVTPER